MHYKNTNSFKIKLYIFIILYTKQNDFIHCWCSWWRYSWIWGTLIPCSRRWGPRSWSSLSRSYCYKIKKNSVSCISKTDTFKNVIIQTFFVSKFLWWESWTFAFWRTSTNLFVFFPVFFRENENKKYFLIECNKSIPFHFCSLSFSNYSSPGFASINIYISTELFQRGKQGFTTLPFTHSRYIKNFKVVQYFPAFCVLLQICKSVCL